MLFWQEVVDWPSLNGRCVIRKIFSEGEPLRWEKSDTLLLQRHEYYERLEPSKLGKVEHNAITPFDLLYAITVTISPDGKARAVWREQKVR